MSPTPSPGPWYGQHLGLKVLRHIPEKAQTHFLSDKQGNTCIEIYCNPADAVPDYASMDPLQIHLAFHSDTPEADRERLIKAGATEHETLSFDDGTTLVMMRDPWGLAVQLCKRAKPLLDR